MDVCPLGCWGQPVREGGQLLWTLDSPVYPKVIGTNRLQTPSAGQGVGEWALGWAWMHALASAALAVWPAQVLGLSVVLPSRPLQDVVTVATLSLSKCGHLELFFVCTWFWRLFPFPF